MSSPKAQKAKRDRRRRADKRVRDARIVEDLPLAELKKLPKLSETLVEFAQPLLATIPTPPRLRDVKSAFKLTQLAWNLPLLRQRDEASTVEARWAALAPEMPDACLAAMEVLMALRRTQYGHDPRLAKVQVQEAGSGRYTVHAETALLVGESQQTRSARVDTSDLYTREPNPNR